MIGKTLGKYHIVDRLGRGGMAEVYEAYQANLDRYVAVKLIRTDSAQNPDYLTRFERGAAATLSAPGGGSGAGGAPTSTAAPGLATKTPQPTRIADTKTPSPTP